MYKIGFMGMLDCSFQFNLSNDMKTNKVHWQKHLKNKRNERELCRYIYIVTHLLTQEIPFLFSPFPGTFIIR